MDKYEYKIRAEEIRELVMQGDYVQASEIADTIDWRRIRNVKMLCTVSDLYKINRRYEDARDLLKLAYEYRPGGRNICFALCELSIKTEEYVQAIEYYKEFVLIAPKDPGRFILQYKLYEAQDVSLEERIEVLEELKKFDYREKWVYELAYLYHRVGLATRCVEECDELISMLGEGNYVIKAMELKMLHQPLSPEQQTVYDHRFDEIPIQEEYAEAVEPSDTAADAQEYGQEYQEVFEEQEPQPDEMTQEPVPMEETPAEETVSDPEPAPQAGKEDELDIHVKIVDVGEYNTINLQAEIEQGMREVYASEQRVQENPITRSIVAPLLETDTELPILPLEPEPEAASPEVETEVFFGETGNIDIIPKEPDAEVSEQAADKTGEAVMEQLRRQVLTEDIQAVMTAEPPKQMAHVLSQESDGQISLVVPDSQNVEKQITGQMNIGDILAEWERMKQENVEKRKEDVRQHVLQQTGQMFSEFDAAARDGLLEQLEKKAEEEVAREAEEDVLTEFDEVEELVEVAEAEPEPEPETEPEEVAEAEPEPEPEIEPEEVAEAESEPEPEPEPEPDSIEARVRPMTQEEQELYEPFVQSEAAREQIVKAIDGISLAAYTGNVIITGEEGTDTIALAKSMVKEVQSTDNNFSGKIAKISGQVLNKKDVKEIAAQLQNGALIIEKACDMSTATTQQLYKVLQNEDLGIVVVMEDTRKVMNSFLLEHGELLSVFTVRVDVEALSTETLVAFGRQYAYEMEYAIDELGGLALHTRIEEKQTLDHAVTSSEVKSMVDAAIRHANRKNVRHLFDILCFKRYDENDMIILTEKDFA